MSLFNPPLDERGNKKCPNCGQPQSWIRLYVRSGWIWNGWQWNCPRCHSVLTKDGGRLIPGLVAVALLVAVMSLIDLWDRPLWVIVSYLIGTFAMAGFLEWWLASVVLRHPAQPQIRTETKGR